MCNCNTCHKPKPRCSDPCNYCQVKPVTNVSCLPAPCITGCDDYIKSDCVNYVGQTLICTTSNPAFSIKNGEILTSVIQTLFEAICNLTNVQPFNCSMLNSCSIDALGDVMIDTSTLTINQALMWDGTNFVNTTVNLPSTLCDLSFPTTSINPTSFDLLVKNGTACGKLAGNECSVIGFDSTGRPSVVPKSTVAKLVYKNYLSTPICGTLTNFILANGATNCRNLTPLTVEYPNPITNNTNCIKTYHIQIFSNFEWELDNYDPLYTQQIYTITRDAYYAIYNNSPVVACSFPVINSIFLTVMQKRGVTILQDLNSTGYDGTNSLIDNLNDSFLVNLNPGETLDLNVFLYIQDLHIFNTTTKALLGTSMVDRCSDITTIIHEI